jgi:hypothetical protein
MNSVLAERLERAWLKVTKVSEGTNYVLRGELFDGSLFEFTVPQHQFEPLGGGVVEVGYVGDKSGYSEIILPSPALNYGFTVRVKPHQLFKWQFIEEVRKQQQQGEKK